MERPRQLTGSTIGLRAWQRIRWFEDVRGVALTDAPLVCAGTKGGELWAADERGVHCSEDGGKRWRRVAAHARSPQHLRGLALVR